MECRANCGACCIAPSISSSIPGMPQGKPANIPCPHLNAHFQCGLFNHSSRPAVCCNLQPNLEMCRHSREQALIYLSELEQLTAP